jgi:hypothetical protein
MCIFRALPRNGFTCHGWLSIVIKYIFSSYSLYIKLSDFKIDQRPTILKAGEAESCYSFLRWEKSLFKIAVVFMCRDWWIPTARVRRRKRLKDLLDGLGIK